MMRKGPNDARCIVWALGECFLISFMFFLSDNTCFIADVAYNLQTTSQGGIWRAIMMRKGPNNARHVVWALGECFLISFVFFDDNICFIEDMAYNIQIT